MVFHSPIWKCCTLARESNACCFSFCSAQPMRTIYMPTKLRTSPLKIQPLSCLLTGIELAFIVRARARNAFRVCVPVLRTGCHIGVSKAGPASSPIVVVRKSAQMPLHHVDVFASIASLMKARLRDPRSRSSKVHLDLIRVREFPQLD